MDLPITPKFFRKLELFQELLRLDKRNAKHIEWDMEKEFLLWAHKSHFHLGTYLDTQRAMAILEECKKFNPPQLNEHVFKMMQNLEEHGWASWYSKREHENSIKINQAGMLMGEVINDSISKNKLFIFYLVSYLSWLVFVLTIIGLMLGVLKLIIEIF